MFNLWACSVVAFLGLLFSNPAEARTCKQDPDRSIEWVRDLDGDGVIDALDWDRDGDLVHDRIDLAPEDPKVVGKDSDADAIPDHVDWADPLLGALQSVIWRKTGILWVAEADALPSAEQLQEGYDWIVKAKSWGVTFGELQIVELVSQWKGNHAHAKGLGARYNPHLRLIQVQVEAQAEKQPDARLSHRLAHELGHAVLQAKPALRATFLDLTGWLLEETVLGPHWSYPQGESYTAFLEVDALIEPKKIQAEIKGPEFVSETAKLSGDEMFAETWAYFEAGGTTTEPLKRMGDWMAQCRDKRGARRSLR